MSLSPELRALQDRQSTYRGDFTTQDLIANKVLSMIVSPTATGKSTIINEVLRQQDDWAVVGSTTTRTRREGDSENYQTSTEGITIPVMIEQIKNGKLVNYSIHPGGDIYGTAAEGFSAKYNLFPVLTDSVHTLKQAGFERTETTFIVSSVDNWQTWLGSRLSDPKIKARMAEAVTSLEFGIQNAQWLHFVENSSQPRGLQLAAKKMIDITLMNYPQAINKERELKLAAAMLDFAKDIVVKS